MLKDTRTISCYSTKLLLGYATHKHVDLDKAMDGVGCNAAYLMFNKNWTTKDIWCKLADNICKELSINMYQLGYDATIYAKQKSIFVLKILYQLPFFMLSKLLGHIMITHINKGVDASVYMDEDNVIFKLRPLDGDLYDKRICLFNGGSFAAITDIRRGSSGVISEEIKCFYEDSDECVYKMIYSEPKYFNSGRSVPITEDDIDAVFTTKRGWR